MTAPTLFDAPGPRARVRHGTLGVVSVLVVAALLAFVVARLVATGQFDGTVWDWILYERIQLALVDGLLNTLRAFALGAVLALAFAVVFALGRLSERAAVRAVSTAVVELFRAVPLVVLMFVFYFGLPSVGLTVSIYAAVVLGLTFYNGSVLAVPRGQSEAAYALGLRRSQVMATVLVPQAVRSMLPAIVSQLVVLLKDTALGFLILYPELLYQARLLGSAPELARPLLPVGFVVAVVYITLCLLLTALAGRLERRTRRAARAPEPAAAPMDA